LGFTGLVCFTGLVGALRGTEDEVRGGTMDSFFSAAALGAVAFVDGIEVSMRSLARTISHHFLALFTSLPTVLLKTAIQPSLF